MELANPLSTQNDQRLRGQGYSIKADSMISIQKQFLFIHVPKTGGNSIQNILKDYSEDDIVTQADHQDGIERFEVRNRQYDITKHSSLSHYRSVLDPDTYSKLFKFAVIRNPWDRLISFYFSPHRGVNEWRRSDFLELMKKVKTFQQYVFEDQPQAHAAKKLDAEIDFIIRFEQIERDFEIVCQKLDIQNTNLPKRNASTRVHYSKYYDEELIRIVYDKFKAEIEYGEYSFETL